MRRLSPLSLVCLPLVAVVPSDVISFCDAQFIQLYYCCTAIANLSKLASSGFVKTVLVQIIFPLQKYYKYKFWW
jgi:hypothetical protein